jgi:hypothetical protein
MYHINVSLIYIYKIRQMIMDIWSNGNQQMLWFNKLFWQNKIFEKEIRDLLSINTLVTQFMLYLSYLCIHLICFFTLIILNKNYIYGNTRIPCKLTMASFTFKGYNLIYYHWFKMPNWDLPLLCLLTLQRCWSWHSHYWKKMQTSNDIVFKYLYFLIIAFKT